MKPIILLGGGGHCKSVIEAAISCGRGIKGILDLPNAVGSSCLGYLVIGTDNDIPKYVDECEFVVTLGFIINPLKRIELHAMVEKFNGKFATIISSTSYVSRFAEIKPGTVVLHGAVVNAGARIGKGCIINTLADIEHDVTIGDYCHISTGVMVNGNCNIGSGTFIGSRSVVNNGTDICSDAVVGAGSVVTKNIIERGTYCGCPVRRV